MAIIPFIIAIVQGAKTVGLPGRFAPVLSLALGVGIVALVSQLGWQAVIIQGLIAGLAASGLWSGGKAVIADPQA